MSETQATVRTFDEVSQEYKKAEELKKGYHWKLPNYDWNVKNITELQNMPISKLLEHLKKVIAGTLAINNLKQSYQQTTDSYLNEYNNNLDKLNSDYKEFYDTSRHPNEIKYCHQNGLTELPKESRIDTSDTTMSKHMFIFGIIIFFISIFLVDHFSMFLNALFSIILILDVLVLIPASILYYIFARLDLSFSQPYESWQNKKIRDLKNSIKNADIKYCKDNDRTKKTLLKEFKYNELLNSEYSLYVERMSNENLVTKNQLVNYINEIQENIKYFPLEDTKDTRHLFRIYNSLWTGRATNWREALQVVDQSEQVEDLKNNLVSEIRNARSDIYGVIDQTRKELVSATDKQMGLIDDLNQTMERQRQSIEYWGNMQTEIQMDQMVLMEQVRHK